MAAREALTDDLRGKGDVSGAGAAAERVRLGAGEPGTRWKGSWAWLLGLGLVEVAVVVQTRQLGKERFEAPWATWGAKAG